MNGGGQGAHGRATQVRDAIACLDVLAAHLRSRGWAAYLATPPGRVAFLAVQDPDDHAAGSDIVAAPGTTGDWWYWFSWAERIAPVHAPATAADAIIRARSATWQGPVAGVR
jgi:hypothetical protein